MKENLSINAVNQIQKDSVIYQAGEPFSSVGLLLKGRVLVEADGIRTVFSSGNFLGACDVEHDTHSFTYIAYDNAVVYVFPVQSHKDFENVLQKNGEYYGLLNTSLNFFIAEMYRTYMLLQEHCEDAKKFICQQYEDYKRIGIESGIAPHYISFIENLQKEKTETITLDNRIPYYIASAKVPVTAQKDFYMGNNFVSIYHFKEQRQCIFSLLEALTSRSKEMLWYFRTMVSDEKNLFSLVSEQAMNLGHMERENSEQVAAVDALLQKINDVETFLVDKLGQKVTINRERMEKIYFSLLSGVLPDDIDLAAEVNIEDLNHSLDQILSYATIDKEVKDEFVEHLNAFKALPDKVSKSDEAARVRRKLSTHYYDIYEQVFFKTLEDDNPPTVIKLFLNYGYICETLMKENHLKELITLKNKNEYKDGCQVYTMSEWLKSIYKMEKVPSKNEFDQDFEQYLRQEKQESRITAEDEQRLITDPKARVHYEIQNLLRYSNRILHGKITSFVPVLFSEGFMSLMPNSHLTADKINGQISSIEAVDFSVFYRESFSFYEELGIAKQVIFERYCPDIILFPICGQNTLMWQDIIGKKRTTKGRLLFPAFLEQSLEKEVLKVIGEFRWEVCRSEQGMHWNDIHYPSLVSEYSDYLQFYKKNPALSMDVKEKIKSQLAKSSNRHRTVFAQDYADWILREANGAMRVNKLVRNILATYCPFRKNIRDKLNEQPVNAEAGKRFKIERSKLLRQIETNCNKFDKAGIPIPKEVQEMLEYLKNT